MTNPVAVPIPTDLPRLETPIRKGVLVARFKLTFLKDSPPEVRVLSREEVSLTFERWNRGDPWDSIKTTIKAGQSQLPQPPFFLEGDHTSRRYVPYGHQPHVVVENATADPILDSRGMIVETLSLRLCMTRGLRRVVIETEEGTVTANNVFIDDFSVPIHERGEPVFVSFRVRAPEINFSTPARAPGKGIVP